MDTAIEQLVAAVEALPPDLRSDEVVALFGAYDQLLARLSAAIDQVDPASDGAVSMAQWLASSRSAWRRGGRRARQAGGAAAVVRGCA